MSQISDEELLAEAYVATENSYVFYSGFLAGVALLLDNGMVVIGCNVESASYGLANCTECIAAFHMVMEHGSNHRIAACAIVGRKAVLCHPCGACRQVLHELGCKRAVVEPERPTDGGLGAPTSIDFKKILPYVFGSEDL